MSFANVEGSSETDPTAAAESAKPESTETGSGIDPCFVDFKAALEQLKTREDVELKDVFSNLLPGRKGISRLRGSESQRPYICAELVVSGKRWIILELCLTDGYSLSTLFIRSDSDKNELAKQMLGKLLDAHGHWSKRCFTTGEIHCMLDHRERRSPERWAQLMYDKMTQ
jgi:hypothetical protein